MKNSTQAVTSTAEKPLFFYGHKTVEWKGQSITRRVAFAGVQVAPNAIRIGEAMCSEKDKFIKKKARAIATGRAISKPKDVLYLTDDSSPAKQFISRVLTFVDPE